MDKKDEVLERTLIQVIQHMSCNIYSLSVFHSCLTRKIIMIMVASEIPRSEKSVAQSP